MKYYIFYLKTTGIYFFLKSHCVKKIALSSHGCTLQANVVVLALSVAENLPGDEIWISYGTRKYLRHLAAHKSTSRIGQKKSKSLTTVPCHHWL